VRREEFLDKQASLRMAPRGRGERYPHKPLLLLWLLGRMQLHGNSACTYEEAEKPVSRLLNDFGPPSKQRYRAPMPFVHLDPAPRHPTPSATHVHWHYNQVFKASA
jgi:putative restriction endonuclease